MENEIKIGLVQCGSYYGKPKLARRWNLGGWDDSCAASLLALCRWSSRMPSPGCSNRGRGVLFSKLDFKFEVPLFMKLVAECLSKSIELIPKGLEKARSIILGSDIEYCLQYVNIIYAPHLLPIHVFRFYHSVVSSLSFSARLFFDVVPFYAVDLGPHRSKR